MAGQFVLKLTDLRVGLAAERARLALSFLQPFAAHVMHLQTVRSCPVRVLLSTS